ncbi:MAG: extracellular solute-binding protein [Clostridia bacterium]|nr:extracellular solute-binding protein [Clostridia bacterium]
MKRTLALLLSLLLVLTLALPVLSSAEEKTQLTILWWGSQTRHDLTVAMIEKFEEKYPDIDLIVDYSDWGGYWTKLAAQVAGGQAPDIFQMDYAYLAQYATNNVLAPLDTYMADGTLDVTNVSENIIKTGQVNGVTYAISTGTNAPVMLYRKDIIEELGLEIPMTPTASEYADLSRKIAEATGLRSTYITDCSADILRFRLRNYGLNLYNEEATQLGFDDPKYIVDMWQDALDAQHEGWGMIPGEETAATAFDSMVNDSWSRYQNSNELAAYRDSTGLDISMVQIPNLDDATASATYLKPSMFWCIAQQSEKKEAAVKFLNFFTNDPECFDIIGVERAIPISSEMRAHVSENLDAVGQEVAAFIEYASLPGNASPLMNPDPAVHSQVADLLGQYSEQVRYEMIDDLEATALQFIEEANEILASAPVAE